MFNTNARQFTTPIQIKHRVITNVNGAARVTYEDADPNIDVCQWKGKGGTESTESATPAIFDTAEVTMWYRPDIVVTDVLLLFPFDSQAYEVKNVEDIEQRHQKMILKVERVAIG